MVDVRDVARLHTLALVTEEAGGHRIIAANSTFLHQTDALELNG